MCWLLSNPTKKVWQKMSERANFLLCLVYYFFTLWIIFSAFSEMDKNHDGQITQDEFIEVNHLQGPHRKMCFCQDYNAQNVFFDIFSKVDFLLMCMDVQALRPYFNYTLLYKWSFKKVHSSGSPREIFILRILTKRIVSNYHIGEAYYGFDDGAE